MTFPSEPTPPERKNPRVLVLYGAPKIGKTTILSTLKNNLIIDLENGTDFISALKLKVKSVQELKNICHSLKTTDPKPYKFVSIDTVDVLDDWAELDGTMLYKYSPQGKNFTGSSVLNLANGAGYLWLRQSFMDMFNACCHTAEHVIFVGHLRDKIIELQGREVMAKDLNLTGKLRSMVCSFADAIGYLSRTKDGKITINFSTTDVVVCGSRCDHLKNKTFEMSNDAKEFDWSKIYI